MFNLKHLTGLKNLTRADIEYILNVARNLESVFAGQKVSRILENRVLATLFYEPSTRTRLSFQERSILDLGLYLGTHLGTPCLPGSA
jgi:aspartate carbamoyltransferase catalytic subunit